MEQLNGRPEWIVSHAVDYEGNPLHGVKLIARQTDLSGYCLSNAEVDTCVDLVMQELETARQQMKGWLKYRPRASSIGIEK